MEHTHSPESNEGQTKREIQQRLSALNRAKTPEKQVNAIREIAHYLASQLLEHPKEPVLRYFDEVSATLGFMTDYMEGQILRAALRETLDMIPSSLRRTELQSSG